MQIHSVSVMNLALLPPSRVIFYLKRCKKLHPANYAHHHLFHNLFLKKFTPFASPCFVVYNKYVGIFCCRLVLDWEIGYFMRKYLKNITLALIVSLAVNNIVNAANINVTVTNIKNMKGVVRIGIINKEGDFPYEAFTGKKVPINGNSVNVKFTGIAPGEYAIVVHHDENSNDKLDKNVLGVPLEGYCFSNNVKAFAAPPKFKYAKFMLDTSFSQTLKMINL